MTYYQHDPRIVYQHQHHPLRPAPAPAHHQQQQQQPYPTHSFSNHQPQPQPQPQPLYTAQPQSQLHRAPSTTPFVPQNAYYYSQPHQNYPQQPSAHYQTQHPPRAPSTRPQSAFRRPLPLPTPQRSETVPPLQRGHNFAYTSTGAVSAALPRAPTAAPSISIPSSSFPNGLPPNFLSPIRSASPTTRRPLPSPVNPPYPKHYSLDLGNRRVSSTNWHDPEETTGRSRSESPVKKIESPIQSPVKWTGSSSNAPDIPNSSPVSSSSTPFSSIPQVGPTGTKFVPLWKRGLNPGVPFSTQSSSGTATTSTGGGKRALPPSPDGNVGVVDLRRRNTSAVNSDHPHSLLKFDYPLSHSNSASNSISSTKPELPRPPGAVRYDAEAETNGERPLPVAPGDLESGSESESESESGSEDVSEVESGAPSSPQYGILDLPRRNVGVGLGDGKQVEGSMTLRFAQLELEQSGSHTQRKTDSVPDSMTSGSWSSPDPFPRSSRTPNAPPSQVSHARNASIQAGKRRINYEDLDDDPPPPSLPRPPSSTSQRTDGGGQSRRQPPPRWQPSTTTPAVVLHPVPQPPSPSTTRSLSDNVIHEVPPPRIHIESPSPMGGRDTRADIPQLEMSQAEESGNDGQDSPMITINGPPVINVSGPEPEITISEPDVPNNNDNGGGVQPQQRALPPLPRRGGGLVCGGCGAPIIGRILSAMGVRWHPTCFKCTVCQCLLEHVSSYEHEGRPYCHLDYHESFAPRCYTCKTAIIDERFITLDDPALGKRAYHEQHFFCAECGNPFLAPSISPAGPSERAGELSVAGDGEFAEGGIKFTVYKGYPYCKTCHEKLRSPKCRKCKASITDEMQAVEALGGKWCWGCFVCAGCDKPFEDPSFFEREGMPFCEHCFTIILRNEL